jgi:uncharacterized membrane protein YhfC
MIALPIVLWIYFTRRFSLSWRLVLAGGLTFIASQIPHIPLVFAIGPFLKGLSLSVNAIILGLLAGIFEETSRYILFKSILKKSRSWKEGVLVGLGHGGTEAAILGVITALTFANMIVYRNMDLSAVPGIRADQLEAARQQVAAYWSAQWYIALLPFVERIFAICLHVSLSVMVLYSIASHKPTWFWLALLWHAIVDAVAVYAGPKVGALPLEGIVAIFAIISLWIIVKMRSWFSEDITNTPEQEVTVGQGR